MSRLWLFHLLAEDELAALRVGRHWAGDVAGGPSAAVAALSRARDGRGPGLLQRGDRVVGAHPAVGPCRIGAAWCPTPAAVARLARESAPIPAARIVSSTALIAANARESFADLDPIPGAAVAEDLAAVRLAVLRSAPGRATGKQPAWLLRHSLAAAGRGRCLAETWDATVEAFARRALQLGPVHVLPLVDIAAEFALHGRLGADGGLAVGRPVANVVAGGAWSSSSATHDLDAAECRALRNAFDEVAARLIALGYHGPFGIDALRWTDCRGRTRFNAPTDVNARYTMSFAVGAKGLVE